MSSELLKEFLIESFDNLSTMTEDITRLESNPEDLELLNKIYRVIHTLKGSASFLNYQKLQDLTHSAENVLDLLRDKKIGLNSSIIDVLLESCDLCNSFLKNIEATEKEGDVEYTQNKNQLLKVIEMKGNFGIATDEVIHNQPKESQASLKKEAQAKPPVEEVKEVKKIAKEKTPAPEPVKEKVKEKATKGPKAPAPVKAKENVLSVADSVVKVSVNLLDKIMNEVGELVLNRNQILQFANSSSSNELIRLVQQLNVITTELQTDIMTTRMQPIGSVLTKFERVIRDLARNTGKKLRLEVTGKDTELDKTLLEAIKDPLTHIIRNSVDHGIENPDERIAKGKPEEGTIDIRSYHESGQVIVEIVDDGKGLDKERILNKGIEKGVITAEEALTMEDNQIFGLIFAAGFSTAEQVTNISGRGVGMDVVRTNIEKIGGAVHVSSVKDQGTVFKLKIPLTLAIVPALIVESMNEPFAIPQVNLVELVHVDLEDESELSKIEKIYGADFIRLRGNLIPLFKIDDVLQLEKFHERNKKMNNVENEVRDPVDESKLNVVILNAEGWTFGIVVEKILNTEEIVVKPFGKNLKGISTFAGATIMGDGKVALIVDALGFYKYVNAGLDKSEGNKIENIDDNKSESDNGEYQENLLFQLADERTYCVPLSIVYRLEDFTVGDIEFTGSQPVIKYNNRPMPLINLEDSLDYKDQGLLSSIDKLEKSVGIPCVVLKIRDQLFGFVVKEILDISISEVTIDTDTVDREGILGTILIDDKFISMIDPYSILNLQAFIQFSQTSTDRPFEGKKVLLVEDSVMYRKIESEALEEKGAEVVTAVDGKIALEIFLADESIDLIVTDIEMPVMDGWEFTEKVRANKTRGDITIIAVSTRVSIADRERGIECGFDAHLEKFRKEELVKEVGKYLA